MTQLKFLCFIVLVVKAILAIQSSAAAQVGFREIMFNDLKVGVWYPTDVYEEAGRIGPFDVVLAMNSPPDTTGKFQPVLMSHGNSGRMRNHHLTAKALANADFIAIAPLHSADHLVGTADTYKAMNWRSNELRHALEAVVQIEEFRKITDLSRIHALGYSLGGVTALNAAGAGLDKAIIDAHCAEETDPAFCDEPSWFLRHRIKWLRDVTAPSLDRDIPDRFFPVPFVNGGVAVIAPVGQGIVYDENMFQAQSVFIVGLNSDDVTVPQYHAQYIADVLPSEKIAHFSLQDGHHSAFIAPFAKRVTDHEHIDAAIDPPGFDRKKFLDSLNAELAEFFSANKG
jgi:predicted dienelactone hydrolase